MTKHYIAVGIVDHKLIGMPHILKVNGARDRSTIARGLKPIRGLATAMILSSALWVALVAIFA